MSIDVITRYEELKNCPEQNQFERTSEIISEYIAPGRAVFSESSANIDGIQGPAWDNRFRFDGTAPLAVSTLAGHIHTNMMPQHMNIADLKVRGAVGKEPEVKLWAEQVSNIVWGRIQDSNFFVETQAQLEDMTAFSLSPIWFLTEGEQDTLQFKFRVDAPGQYYFETDVDGTVTEFYTLLKMKRAAVESYFRDQELTSEANEVLAGLAMISEDEEVQIVHGVYLNPNASKDKGTVAPRLRKYVEEYRFLTHGDRELVVPVNGYTESPVYMGVYQRLSGSKFGVCPGVLSVDTVLSLNQAGALMFEAAEKTINPSIIKKRNEVYGDADLRAGGATTVKSSDSLTTLDLGNYAASKDLYELLISLVEKMFHIDRLTIKESSRMTATEVNVSLDMMNRILGPVSSTHEKNVITPIFMRAYSKCAKEGLLPEKPPELEDVDIDVELKFNGTLSIARKQTDLQQVSAYLSVVERLAAFDPEVAQRQDTNAIMSLAQEATGASPTAIKDETQADQEIQDANDQQGQLEALSTGAEAIRNAGQGALASAKATGQV